MRLELTRVGLLVELANHYTTRGALIIYEALCFDVAQGRMNGVPNETRTHSCSMDVTCAHIRSLTYALLHRMFSGTKINKCEI